MMHEVKVNYFPYKYAYQVKDINKDFWGNETSKYSRDIMISPILSKETMVSNDFKNINEIQV